MAIPLVLMGIGVGLAGTPSSNSLTGSVPVRRVGMASGTADLQRDLGGALMTSIFGALLTAGYAAAMGTAIADSVRTSRPRHRASSSSPMRARRTWQHQYPQYGDQITERRAVLLPRRRPAGLPRGLVAVVIGGALTFFVFPKKEDEENMRLAFHAEDEAPSIGAGSTPTALPARVPLAG